MTVFDPEPPRRMAAAPDAPEDAIGAERRRPRAGRWRTQAAQGELGARASRGDASANAFHTLGWCEIGLFKTEVLQRQGPWRSAETVEFAALDWVDWFNTRRLLAPIGDVRPAEFEAQYYAQAAVA